MFLRRFSACDANVLECEKVVFFPVHVTDSVRPERILVVRQPQACQCLQFRDSSFVHPKQISMPSLV